MNKIFLTAGQIAAIHGINKKTLYYYDEIGLFSPIYKNKKGYRFYSYEQCIELEAILSLRELDIPVSDLLVYTNDRSQENLRNLLLTSKNEATKKLESLNNTIEFLNTQLNALGEISYDTLNTISVQTLPEEKLISCSTADDDYKNIVATMSDILKQQIKQHFHSFSFGSILSKENIEKEKYENYYSYFVKTPPSFLQSNTIIKPAGTYLVVLWKGSWETLPRAYKKLVQYAENYNYTICGSSYEENLIDSFSAKNEKDYITKIMLHVSK